MSTCLISADVCCCPPLYGTTGAISVGALPAGVPVPKPPAMRARRTQGERIVAKWNCRLNISQALHLNNGTKARTSTGLLTHRSISLRVSIKAWIAVVSI